MSVSDDMSPTLTTKAMTTTAANAQRVQAKLRLISAHFSPDTGLSLPDLNAQIISTSSLGAKFQTDALANILAAAGTKQNDTLDCINRYTHWPEAYRWVP